MVGWHHPLNGGEFEQTLRVDDGQGSLACCSPWGHKESETTEGLNSMFPKRPCVPVFLAPSGRTLSTPRATSVPLFSSSDLQMLSTGPAVLIRKLADVYVFLNKSLVALQSPVSTQTLRNV